LSSGGEQPPSFILLTDTTEPFPTDIAGLTPNEKIYLALYPVADSNQEVLSARFTFFNKGTNQESDIEFLDGTPSLATTSFTSCYAPTVPGNYEARVYFGGKLAASQPFVIT
jgi:hypothetical protein